MGQVIYKRHSRALPEAAGWAAACISLLAVPIAAWWAIWRTELVVERAAATAVIESLQAGDPAAAEQYLDQALNRPRYEGWIRGDFSGTSPEQLHNLERISHLLLQTLRGIVEGQPQNAADAFQNIEAAQLEALLARTADDGGGLDLYERIQRNFKSWRELSSQLDQADRDRSRAQRELEGVRDRFRTLQAEFSAFLSVRNDLPLPPQLADGVYPSGVLAGIPMISDIPGTAPDLIELKQGLDRIGGRVRTTTDNPHREFLDRVASTRGSAQSMIELERRLSDQIGSVQQSVLRLDRVRQETATALEHDLRTTLELLVVKGS